MFLSQHMNLICLFLIDRLYIYIHDPHYRTIITNKRKTLNICTCQANTHFLSICEGDICMWELTIIRMQFWFDTIKFLLIGWVYLIKPHYYVKLYHVHALTSPFPFFLCCLSCIKHIIFTSLFLIFVNYFLMKTA